MATKIFFTWTEFDYAMDVIVSSLRCEGLVSKVSQVYGIPRGGLVLAVVLSHRLGVPLASLADVVAAGNALIVDDISDSGQTLKRFGALGTVTATIHLVPGAVYVPDVWVFQRPENSWVVYPWETEIKGGFSG